jgi:hypothetical protein
MPIGMFQLMNGVSAANKQGPMWPSLRLPICVPAVSLRLQLACVSGVSDQSCFHFCFRGGCLHDDLNSLLQLGTMAGAPRSLHHFWLTVTRTMVANDLSHVQYLPRAMWPSAKKVTDVAMWGGVGATGLLFMVQPWDFLAENLGLKKQTGK